MKKLIALVALLVLTSACGTLKMKYEDAEGRVISIDGTVDKEVAKEAVEGL